MARGSHLENVGIHRLALRFLELSKTTSIFAENSATHLSPIDAREAEQRYLQDKIEVRPDEQLYSRGTCRAHDETSNKLLHPARRRIADPADCDRDTHPARNRAHEFRPDLHHTHGDCDK